MLGYANNPKIQATINYITGVVNKRLNELLYFYMFDIMF